MLAALIVIEDRGSREREDGESQRHWRLGNRSSICSGRSNRKIGERIFRFVMLWRNSPIRRPGRNVPLNAANWRASERRAVSPPFVSPPGSSHRPARIPRRSRLRSRIFPPLRTMTKGQSTSLFTAGLPIGKLAVSLPFARAPQCKATGQHRQRGSLGIQTVAPSSISP